MATKRKNLSKSGPSRATGTSFGSIIRDQRGREEAVNRALKISKSSYSGRATEASRLNWSAPHPNYQGPIEDVGKGTNDQMPGADYPNKKRVRRKRNPLENYI
jgi:hypothetical protein